MGINVKDARWPGCSAENFGRFIPCRGGGTATTYYTDFHDVDEELMSISAQGGHCGDDKYWSHTEAGIAMRHQGYTPTEVFDVVASKK